jgi:hypothetical protein
MNRQEKPQEQPYQLQSEEMRNFVDPLFADKQNPEEEKGKLGLGALICGIAGLVFFCEWHISLLAGVIAVVLGILSRLRHEDEFKQFAVAGIVMGICACAIQGGLALFPVLREALGGIAGGMMPNI